MELKLNYSNLVINGKHEDLHSNKLISIFSPTFQYGLNVFEGIRGYSINNKLTEPFLLEDHINRLLSSARMIGFEGNLDYEIVNSDIKLLLSQNQTYDNVYIKYIVGYISEASWMSVLNPDRICYFYKLKSTLLDNSPKDTVASFSSISRISSNSLSPKAKCGANYINSRFAFLDVNSNSKESVYPIFLDENGFVSESSGSCIFAIKGNEISTPTLDSSILESITRKFILDNVSAFLKDYTFKEKKLDRWDLINSDALFLAGTTLEILVIRKLDHVEFNKNNKTLNLIIQTFRNLIFK